MLIAQITDTHVTAPEVRKMRGTDTGARLAAAVDALAALTPAPDVILATGDLVHDGDAPEHARLRGLLAPLTAPVLVVPGNHDRRDLLRQTFPDHPWLPASGPFNYVVDDFPVRLIALDSLVPDQVGGQLGSETLAWLAARLAEAPARPTAIFLHHPPFATGLPGFDAIGCADGDRLADLVAGHGQVALVVAGHAHRALVTHWADTTAVVAPSTAAQAVPRLVPGDIAWSGEPGGFALHHWTEAGRFITHFVGVAP